jgi:hypothetical protein
LGLDRLFAWALRHKDMGDSPATPVAPQAIMAQLNLLAQDQAF